MCYLSYIDTNTKKGWVRKPILIHLDATDGIELIISHILNLLEVSTIMKINYQDFNKK